MIQIREIQNKAEKQKLTEAVLRDLPEWFGIESSTLEYIQNVEKHRFFAASIGTDQKADFLPAGFVSLDFNNSVTAEIYVMGVFKAFHGKGVGKALVNHCKQVLRDHGFRYIMVKTLADSHPDPGYAKTRKFYASAGFSPLQEIPEIWGKQNPCLIMVQSLQKEKL